MRHTILLTIARHAEIKVGITQLGRAADGALVKRLGVIARRSRILFAARRNLTAIPCVVNHRRTEKDQVITQSGDKRHEPAALLNKLADEGGTFANTGAAKAA